MSTFIMSTFTPLCNSLSATLRPVELRWSSTARGLRHASVTSCYMKCSTWGGIHTLVAPLVSVLSELSAAAWIQC